MKYIYIIITAIILLTSCLESDFTEESHQSHGQDEHDHTEKQLGLSLTPQQLKLMEVEIDIPKRKYISNSIKATGVIELPPQNKASLSSIAEGRVKDIKVIEGSIIKKGQTLALIENIEFIEIQQQYLLLRNKQDLLKSDLTRKKNLYKDSIVAFKVVQEVEEAFLGNEIKLKTLKAQLELLGLNISKLEKGEVSSFIPVRSPINGNVRIVNINMNSYVHPGDVLFEIVDNEHLHIDLMVFEKDVPFIKKEQRVTFSITQFPNKVYEASVFAIGKALEEEQRAMRVHAELKEKYHSLLPGMFVNATVYANDNQLLALPSETFIEENNETFIFIEKVNKDSNVKSFDKIKVNKGKEQNGFTEVILSQELKYDSKVVVKGAYYLNAELNKKMFEHSH